MGATTNQFFHMVTHLPSLASWILPMHYCYPLHLLSRARFLFSLSSASAHEVYVSRWQRCLSPNSLLYPQNNAFCIPGAQQILFTQGMIEQKKRQKPQPLDNQEATEMTQLGTHPLPLTHLTCSWGVRGMDSLKGWAISPRLGNFSTGEVRQETCLEFEGSLGFVASARPAGATQQELASNKTKIRQVE